MDVPIPCVCPGTPHDTDTVTLREKLSFHDVKALKVDVGFSAAEDGNTDGDTLAVLAEGYMLRGIESWSLVNDKGKALAVTRENISSYLLGHLAAAEAVSAQAEDLYNADVLLPLVKAVRESSQRSRTDASTSASTDSPKRNRKPSSRSSTTTTRTDATATITALPGGGSNSSQNSASVA